MEPVQNVSFGQISANLHAFNVLPSNTYIHKNRYGYFIPTASNYAWIPGAQATAKLWKGQTNDKLVEDIHTLAREGILAITNDLLALRETSDDETKMRIYRQLLVLNREIEDIQHIKEGGGGLLGILKTYHFEQKACDKIIESFETLREFSASALTEAEEKVSQSYVKQIQLCPEDSFTNEEWVIAAKNSHDFKKECVSLAKYYFNYKTAFLFNEAMNILDATKVKLGDLLGLDWDPSWNWWDEVYVHPTSGAKLILGAMPVSKGAFGYTHRDDLQTFKQMGVNAVLTLQEVFENNSQGIITSPISPSRYEEEDILQLQIPTPDFETMSTEQIARGAAYINWCLENGKTVYVHCKAGRGRSKLIVDSYLVKYQGFSAKQAYDHVKEARKQSGYHGDKAASLVEFEKIYGQKKDFTA